MGEKPKQDFDHVDDDEIEPESQKMLDDAWEEIARSRRLRETLSEGYDD